MLKKKVMEVTQVNKNKKQLTSNENMIDYCQFTMQSLMECYEIVGGRKK